MSADIANLDATSFQSTVDGDTPVLVDFWAPWCGPCKAIAPILEEIATELAGKLTICKMNLDSDGNNAIALELNVRTIPALLLFKNGSVVATSIGVKPKEALLREIEPHL